MNMGVLLLLIVCWEVVLVMWEIMVLIIWWLILIGIKLNVVRLVLVWCIVCVIWVMVFFEGLFCNDCFRML